VRRMFNEVGRGDVANEMRYSRRRRDINADVIDDGDGDDDKHYTAAASCGFDVADWWITSHVTLLTFDLFAIGNTNRPRRSKHSVFTA